MMRLIIEDLPPLALMRFRDGTFAILSGDSVLSIWQHDEEESCFREFIRRGNPTREPLILLDANRFDVLTHDQGKIN